MDPALRQLRIKGDPDDEIEAIIRLKSISDSVPYGAREVSDFGNIRTIRLPRKNVLRIWSHRNVESLKAPRLMHYEKPHRFFGNFGLQPMTAHRNISENGNGVVMGVIDWGFDFAHAAFRDKLGRSRVLALWDQRDIKDFSLNKATSPQPFGYGRVLDNESINKALATDMPYHVLKYHPSDADHGRGAHGTHVADIAAGSPRKGHAGGFASQAGLVFVHMASSPLDGLADLGDSVRLLEAVDFILRVAGSRPVCINMSIGRHGGAHTGLSLVERALDNCVLRRKGIAIVHSSGNYGLSRTHAKGVLLPGSSKLLNWKISRGDTTRNELEVWYSNKDEIRFALYPPNQAAPIFVKLKESKVIRTINGVELGRIYHRANDPNTPDHHIDVIILPNAPAGIWRIKLIGEKIADGRYEAWIERDSSGYKQSRFLRQNVEKSGTIGSIANTFHTITVGAADTTVIPYRMASFASLGPTRDGRIKPDLLAPGVRIVAAKSAPKHFSYPKHQLTQMSGASQASPAIAGVAALCLEAAGGDISINDLKKILISSSGQIKQIGSQYIPPLVNPSAAVNLSRQFKIKRKYQKGVKDESIIYGKNKA